MFKKLFQRHEVVGLNNSYFFHLKINYNLDVSVCHDTEIFSTKTKVHTKNYLWIIFFIKKFIEKLKKRTMISNVSKLNQFHYIALNDNATHPNGTYKFFKDFYENTKKRDFFSNRFKNMKVMNEISSGFISKTMLMFSTILKKLNQKFHVIEPYHSVRFLFDMFILNYTLINVCKIFLIVGFKLDHEDWDPILNFTLDFFVPWIHLFEIMFNLNTAYYSKGNYVKNRNQIFKKYINELFLLDVISLTPLFLTFFFEIHTFELLYTFRLFRIKPLLNKFEEYFHFKGRKEAVFHLFKLILNLLFLAHICACLWQYTALWEIEIGIENNWLKKKSLENESWQVRYVYSLYFAVVTMMTVGYGDITSDNHYEVLINIFIIIYGCGVFAYTINDIGVIFKEMNQDEKLFKKRMKNISEFMNKRKLNKNLQIKIKRYLEYMYEESQNNYKDNSDLSNLLSQTLKDEFLQEIYGKILIKNSFFQTFSPEFLNKLSPYIKEQALAPDDQIYNINEDNEILMFFLLKGEGDIVEKQSDSSNLKLETISEGDTIGEYVFISGQLKKINFKCRNVTHLACLKRTDFLNLILHFKEDQEKFFEIKDKIQFSYELKPKSCLSCQKNHIISECPLLHYIPNIPYIIKKYNFNEPQLRNCMFERRSKGKNARKIKNKVQECAYQVIKKNEEDEDFSQIMSSGSGISSSSCEVGEERTINFNLKKKESKKEKDKSSSELIKYSKRKSIKKTNKSPLLETDDKFSNLKVEIDKEFKDESNKDPHSIKLRHKISDENMFLSRKKTEINKNYEMDHLKNFKFYFPNWNFEIIKSKLRGKRKLNHRVSRQKSPRKQSNFATMSPERKK